MTLIVEDGTGLSTAQSYGTVQGLKDYARARGLNVPSSTADCEALLLKAMQAMMSLPYKGERYSRDQALDFPRLGVVVDGFEYGSSELPPYLAEAQYILAVEAQATDLLPTSVSGTTGAVVERTVEGITTRFSESGLSLTRPVVEKVKPALGKLLRVSGAGMPLIRA